MRVLHKIECKHYGFWGLYGEPVVIHQTELWIVHRRTRQCTRCGEYSHKTARLPRNNALSRAYEHPSGNMAGRFFLP